MRSAIYQWMEQGTPVRRLGKRFLYNLVISAVSFSLLHCLALLLHWRLFGTPFVSEEFWFRCVFFAILFTLIGYGQPNRAVRQKSS